MFCDQNQCKDGQCIVPKTIQLKISMHQTIENNAALIRVETASFYKENKKNFNLKLELINLTPMMNTNLF